MSTSVMSAERPLPASPWVSSMPTESAADTIATRHSGTCQARSVSASPKGTNSSTLAAIWSRITRRAQSSGHARMRSSNGIQVHEPRPSPGCVDGSVTRRMTRTDADQQCVGGGQPDGQQHPSASGAPDERDRERDGQRQQRERSQLRRRAGPHPIDSTGIQPA